MKYKKKKYTYLLISLIVLLFMINYSFIDEKLEKIFFNYEFGIVERIVDGDTIIVNGSSVRLLGINSPEKAKQYSNEAKVFLEELVLDKEIRLEFGKEKYDRYNRILAYISIDGKDINLELVEEGLANFYFPSGKDRYYKKFKGAWENCIKQNKNLCEKSQDKCAECIILKKFDYKNQEVIFHNNCGSDCDLTNWEIKDEGRKIFIFPEFILDYGKEVKIIVEEGKNNNEQLFWKDESYVWTNSGDTLFLRDDEGGLVLWENY